MLLLLKNDVSCTVLTSRRVVTLLLTYRQSRISKPFCFMSSVEPDVLKYAIIRH